MNESAEFLQHISIDSDSKNSLPVKPACENHNRLKDRVKKPRGGYRPVMLDEKSQLAKESIELEPLMKFINEEKSLSDQDKVSLFTLAYLNERYPNNFLECYNPIVVDSDISKSSKSLCDLPIKFKNQKVYSRLQSLNVRTLFDVVNSFNLHSVPYSARFTLANWYLPSRFDLVLFVDRIPSSKQVLKMQANSKRCVTIITNKIDELVLGERDPFSFLLHDLVHAYKMFSNDYLLSGQLGFYRALLKLFSASDETKSNTRTQSCSILEPLLANDAQLVDEFDYLISDMNSHPRHLFFYFKAILITAIKRKHHLDAPDSRLSGSSLSEFDALFESVLERFAMNETEKSLARQMITDETSRNKSAPKPSNTVDFTLLDNFFLSLS